MTDTGGMALVALEVREMREALEASGFAIGNSSGELRRGRVWVRTGYVMGEYYVEAWLKDERGGVVVPGSKHMVRWHPGVPRGEGAKLAAVIAAWKDTPKAKWPPADFPGTHR